MLQGHTAELEAKIQKLLADYTQFRSKAQQMLSAKEEEIDKIKGR